MNKIEDIARNDKELLYDTINQYIYATINNNYIKQLNLDEAYDKHIKYQLKQYLLQEVSNFGEKGYTLLDNKKLLDILHPNQDNKVSDMDYINIRRIANYFNISSRINTIYYKKGIYLTKDISIGLYTIYDEYGSFDNYDAGYIKLVAYFITPDKNINKKITNTIWLEEGVR